MKFLIIRNSAMCLACGKEIESKHRHDFVACGCPNQLFVDGGKDYTRRGAVDLKLYKDTSIYKEMENDAYYAAKAAADKSSNDF
jgi:hypothetical protein